MKPTLYVETTVISYLAANPSRDLIVAAHQRITHEWWQEALPQYSSHISSVVMDEIRRGDRDAAQKRLEAVRGMTALNRTEKVDELAELYFHRLGLPESAQADAYHIALASCYGMNYLVTWNLRHVASARVRQIIEQMNRQRDLHVPEIHTPLTLMEI